MLTDITPQNELDAVNSLLMAIGEQPLDEGADLDTVIQSDVVMARTVLRQVCREALTVGWRFNSELGYEVAPVGTVTLTDTAGISTPLNIFKPDPALIRFTTSPVQSQVGYQEIDLTLRKSRTYQEGMPLANVIVFYDRLHSREGMDASKYPFIYIDPVWFMDFIDCPESFRRYVVSKATRVFVNSSIGAQTLSNYTAPDEQAALRILVEEEGILDEDVNFLSPNEYAAGRGGRCGAPRLYVSPVTNRGAA